MARPLYRLPEGVSCERRGDGHRGLWYDRFCDRWSSGWSLKSENDAKPKLAWIEEVAGGVGSSDLLRAYAERLADLVEARGGVSVVATSRSRFVTGLGRSHPVENGFAWHHTLGTPYLPGSSVKGLTKAWAVGLSSSRDKVDRVLGEPGRAGAVAFLDAVPVCPMTLEADVLTPHYANWTRNDPPGDWRSPDPVPFLVAAPGLSMLFGIIPTGRSGGDDVAVARQWLAAALDESGAGAKTALGYGQFQVEPDHPFLETWEKQRRESKARETPEGRWRLQLRKLTEEELLSAVNTHLINSPLEDRDERRAFVRAVLETGKVASWRRGETTDTRTGTGTKKLRERARAVRKAAEELGVELSQ